MTKLIIFDWDDVFTLGSKEGYFACYHKAINEVGVFLSPEEEYKRILAKWSKPFQEVLKELLKEHPELVDKACEIYDDEYKGNTFVDKLTILPGTIDLLKRLQKKYILAVATGARRKMLQKRIMPHFNIPDVFSQMITSHEIEDPEMTKPHPYMLEIIMKKQGISPNETIFVGDAKTDVQMAFSAHVAPIVVLTGHLNRKEAEELGVKYIVPDITKLETISVL
jgi:HAD superfamily hydrolase (TIGR01549 family)